MKDIEEFNKAKRAKDGHYCWCRECHKKDKKESREKYKQENKCIECGGIIEITQQGKIRCIACSNKHKEYDLKLYAYGISQNRCVGCGRIAEKGKTLCRKCLDKANKKTKKRQQKLREENKCEKCGRELDQERDVTYKDNGDRYMPQLCIYCREPSPRQIPKYAKYLPKIGA